MRVFDGAGTPLRDALIEIWQADAAGLYNSPPRRAARPIRILPAGAASRPTWKPANACSRRSSRVACPFPDGRLMAPHITVWIVARGINIGLHTRMYFGDEEKANAEDPLLARIEHRVRVPTLIAPRDGDTYTFDIHLQGEKETVFFDS